MDRPLPPCFLSPLSFSLVIDDFLIGKPNNFYPGRRTVHIVDAWSPSSDAYNLIKEFEGLYLSAFSKLILIEISNRSHFKNCLFTIFFKQQFVYLGLLIIYAYLLFILISDPEKEIWTTGYGTMEYPNGRKVCSGDRFSQADSFRYLQFEVDQKARGVESAIGGGVYLYQNQFDALVSFTYNLGIGALRRSTLLQKVKRNPNGPIIRQDFERWVYAGGRVLPDVWYFVAGPKLICTLLTCKF